MTPASADTRSSSDGEVPDVVRLRDGTTREVLASLTVRLRASEILARMQGNFVTRHDVRVAPSVTLRIVSDEDPRARLDRLQAKLDGARDDTRTA